MELARVIKKVDAYMPLGTNNPIRQSVYEYSVAGIDGKTLHKVGERIKLDDGRTFVYCKTSVDLSLGSSISTGTSAVSLTAITASAGALSITGTTSSAVAANALAGGFFIAGGAKYVIGGNTAKGSGSGSLGITLLEPLRASLSNASGTAYPNPYSSVVATPASSTAAAVLGVVQLAIPAATDGVSYYFWAQTSGFAVANCVAGGSTGIGAAIVGQSSAEGTLGVQASGSSSVVYGIVGTTLAATSSSAAVVPVILNILN